MTQWRPDTAAGGKALDAILRRPGDTLLAMDFDGTLAPIVDDPEQAHADPLAVAALGRLGPRLGRIAVITGRPARLAVRLGGFAEVPGLRRMTVLGQYGVERWDAEGDRYVLPPDPPDIVAVLADLPALLGVLDLGAARVEHKGRAVAIHTRNLADPADAFARLAGPVGELARRYGLMVEPGKHVWEIRAPGVDKGLALRELVAEAGTRQVIFAGDDLGDLPAFRAVEQLRRDGMPGLLICSGSAEEDALAEMSDLVLDGPTGVAAWLGQLAAAINS